MNYCIKVFLCLFLFFACKGPADKLDALVVRQLIMSGDNRQELEKVLEHYSTSADSDKLYAAKFLIAYMGDKYSVVPDNIVNYNIVVEELSDVTELYPRDEDLSAIGKVLDSLLEQYPVGHIVRPDLTTVSAEFLIDNIEEAFEQWEKVPWHEQYTLDEFCRYVLPYRASIEVLENWRKMALEISLPNEDSIIQQGDLFNIGYELIKYSGVDYNIAAGRFFNRLPYSDMSKVKWGDCAQIAVHAMLLFRSRGIPSAIDLVPQWANRSLRHIWNVILYPGIETHDISFYPEGKNVMLYKPSKIYRRNYDIQDTTLVYRYRHEEDIPDFFTNYCLSDVTGEYDIPVTDVEIDNVVEDRNKILYLCTFDNKEWKPVAYTSVNNGKAVFKDVARGILPGNNVPIQYINQGNGIVLLPAYYYKKGIKAVSCPVILTEKGVVKKIRANKDDLQTVVLTRKYPLDPEFVECRKALIGSCFDASDNDLFKNPEHLFTLSEDFVNTVSIRLSKPYRYIRFFRSDSITNSVAEITFFKSGVKIKPDSVYVFNKSKMIRPLANIWDGDSLTYYDYNGYNGNYIVFDFGKSVEVSEISCLARNDDNDIVPGNHYELCYWDNEWISLGHQVAEDVFLVFDNVPKGALLILHNHTKGEEERIFTYEDGQQVWW